MQISEGGNKNERSGGKGEVNKMEEGVEMENLKKT